MDSKSSEYIKRSERAASDVAKWPKWMQENLKPLKISIPERGQGKHSAAKAE